MLPRMGMVMCWCGKKDCGWKTTHTTTFHGAYKQSPTTIFLPDHHPYKKSLHIFNEITPDIAPAPISSGTNQTVSTVTSA